MIEVHMFGPELAALLDSEVPHRADGAREFSIRLHELFQNALAPYIKRPAGAMKLQVLAFLFGNMLEALGHAVALRRPPTLSIRTAKTEAAKAIVASLRFAIES
jgi:hypothetical protein